MHEDDLSTVLRYRWLVSVVKKEVLDEGVVIGSPIVGYAGRASVLLGK